MAVEEETEFEDEEDDLSPELEKLQDQFQELCRRLKLHDKGFCDTMSSTGVKHPGPAPLTLAEEFEELGAQVLGLGADEDDCKLCLHFALQIRKEHQESEAREERLQCFTNEENERAAQVLSALKLHADAAAVPSTSSPSDQKFSKPAALIRASLEDSRWDSVLLHDVPRHAVPADEDAPFSFLSLPDEAILHVLGFLGHIDVGRVGCTCTYLHSMLAQNDATWQLVQLRGRRHPPYPLEGSWKLAFTHSLDLDESWRQRRNQLQSIAYHSEHVSSVHLWKDMLLAGSGDHTLSLTPLLPRAAPRGQNCHTTYNSVAGVCIGHKSAVSCCQILNSSRAMSASVDGELRFWDIENIVMGYGTESRVVQRAPCLWAVSLNDPVVPSSLTFDIASTNEHSAGSYKIACGGSHPEFGVRVFDAGPAGVYPEVALYTARAEVYQVRYFRDQRIPRILPA
jgi:hypothetical protein